MVTPRVPSVVTNIVATPATPSLDSDARIFMVGVGNEATSRPLNYSNDLADLQSSVPSNGILSGQINALLRARRSQIAMALTAGSPTFEQIQAALIQVRYLDNPPTHIIAPGLTERGRLVGSLANQHSAGTTTITLNAAHGGFTAGEIFVIEDEILELAADAPAGTTLTVVRGAEGSTAATHASDTQIFDLRNQVTAVMESLAEEIECVGVADAPNEDVNHAVAWSDAGNTLPNIMGVYNYVNGEPASGHWLAAVIDNADTHGHQRGIEFTRVPGVNTLAQELTYSPRAEVQTDVSRLVGAYLSTLVRRNGNTVIIGDSLRGHTDARQVWSINEVVRRVQRIAEIAAETYLGRVSSERNMLALAFHIERAVSILVNDGEIRFVTVTPHPMNDTPAARAAGRAQLQATIGVYHPIDTVVIDLTI